MQGVNKVRNLRIRSVQEIMMPVSLLCNLPVTPDASTTMVNARAAIHNILHDNDDRLIVVVGPCSIHDPAAAMEYASKLKIMHDRLHDDLQIVMRVYFEKPRTTVGWKGLINDPGLDGSFDINTGLRIARKLLLDLAKLGLPVGTEFLDLISPQYLNDLISWGAIGARTTESQLHRELASGLSCPVGFKNGTDGSTQIAIDAIVSTKIPHHFLSVTECGQIAIFSTEGNDDSHVILRGGKDGPNYSAPYIQAAAMQLEQSGLRANIMVDCSHANCQKQYRQQIKVAEDIAKQVAIGESRIIGVMLESHIVEGRQDLRPDAALRYGQSITDACIGWEDTEAVLHQLAASVRKRRRVNKTNDNQVA